MKSKKVKCLVWDLDNTVWDGILMEDSEVTLRPGVLEVIQTLDKRGILLSIASRNEFDPAFEKLKAFGIEQYFIYPQINWGAKSASVKAVADAINIGIDTLAFIDDQPFEREEVSSVHSSVLCLDALQLDTVLERDELMPDVLTEDSARRREMYQADIQRKTSESEFAGPSDDFLHTLSMKLEIHPAREEDLARAQELTERTNQLNTTGYTYSYDELNAFRQSDAHGLWVAGLEDRFGTYGKVGLALVEKQDDRWWIRLLLMSCRVINRGVGSVFINFVRNMAREEGVQLFAEMRPNDRNRMMYMTYKFSHFKEIEESDERVVFESDLTVIPEYPAYFELDLRS